MHEYMLEQGTWLLCLALCFPRERKHLNKCERCGGGRYLVGDADAGVVPVGADITERTHDEAVSATTQLVPTNSNTDHHRCINHDE